MTTENTKSHEKYAESTKAYKNTLYRTAVAIRAELEPGLRKFVELSGAGSTSNVFTLLACEPEAFAAMLKADFARVDEARKGTLTRRRHKVTMKSITDHLKDSDLTHEEILAAIEALKAQKSGASGNS